MYDECIGNSNKDFANMILDLYPDLGMDWRCVQDDSPTPMSMPDPTSKNLQPEVSDTTTISEPQEQSKTVSETVYQTTVPNTTTF